MVTAAKLLAAPVESQPAPLAQLSGGCVSKHAPTHGMKMGGAVARRTCGVCEGSIAVWTVMGYRCSRCLGFAGFQDRKAFKTVDRWRQATTFQAKCHARACRKETEEVVYAIAADSTAWVTDMGVVQKCEQNATSRGHEMAREPRTLLSGLHQFKILMGSPSAQSGKARWVALFSWRLGKPRR